LKKETGFCFIELPPPKGSKYQNIYTGIVEKLLVVPTEFVNGKEQMENSRDELYIHQKVIEARFSFLLGIAKNHSLNGIQ
jgi:hypothetical protein